MDYWNDYNLNIPENQENGDSIKDDKLFVHQNFRLWFLTDLKSLNNIPGNVNINILQVQSLAFYGIVILMTNCEYNRNTKL